MARLSLEPLGSPIDQLLSEADRRANAERIADLDQQLDLKLQTVRSGWGDKYVERVHAKGKLTTWERLEQLADPGTPIRAFGSLVNWDREFKGSRRRAPGAGVVTAFVRIEGRWTVTIANDNTVASGAWWPLTPEKIQRAQEIALRLRLPTVYLVDCSGLFLPEQAMSFPGKRGAGHIFKKNALLSAEGVPQIAGVFGDCIAGGGYMPIISDRVFMTEQAYMVIAGAALIRGAKSLKLTSLDIGGPEVHVGQSGCADARVPDDLTALSLIRAEVGRLPSSAVDFYRHGVPPEPPLRGADELSQLFPTDHRQTYPIRQVIARLVDGSLFHEFLPHTGREVVCGVARIQGLWVGILGNDQTLQDHPESPGDKRAGGILYREGIAKLAQFSRACNDDGIPLIWLQDIAGFDIGVEAEAQGLLGYGSSLIYANSTNRTPMITVLLRKASGAGYYAMAGHPYDPVLQLSTPVTRQSVMEGRTLAIAAFNTKLDDDFEIATQDPDERAAIEQGMAETAARIEADMDPVAAAARMDTDEVVPLDEIRGWLEVAVEASYQAVGYRRIKNPRIWSLHDLEVLCPERPLTALSSDEGLRSPSVGTWRPALSAGALLQEGLLLGHLRQLGRWVPVLAPRGAHGQVVDPSPAWSAVEHGSLLIGVGELTAEGAAATLAEAADTGDLVAVKAPMAGTIYRRPRPGEPDFAAAGSSVAPTSTVALMEVMKTFTPVAAGVAGAIERWEVQDADPVDEGAVLAWVRPA